MATMTIPQTRTNAVQFGKFAIVLSKSQLQYYVDGQLHKVKDVANDFNDNDLFDLATRISNGKNYGEVKFVFPSQIVKQGFSKTYK